MFGTKTSPIAIDFGDNSVKVVQIEQRHGKLELRDARCVDVEPDSAGDLETRRIRAAKRALQLGRFKGKSAISALRLDDITTRHIRVPKAHLDAPGSFLNREIHDQAATDETSFCAIPVADLLERGEQRREYLCCVAKTDLIQTHIARVEALGLRPTAIDLESCAQVRPFVVHGDRSSFLNVDVGSHSTRITIVKDGVPVLMRTVPVGGSEMAVALRDKLDLSVDEIMRLAEEDTEQDALQASVVSALTQQLDLVLGRLADCVRYCASLFQGRAVSPLRVMGSVSNLPGFAAHLGRRIGIKAEVADPFAALEFTTISGWRRVSRGTYSTALGLALRGLES